MKKILIVDDEKITLRMTEHILSSQYETICAQSGRDAIEIYRRERPDLILSDLYADSIPIMFMTADKSDDAESRGFESGAVDFIRKPFRADVLLKRVEKSFPTRRRCRGSSGRHRRIP